MATLTELFTNIANAIRTKTGDTAPIVANDFPTAIANIQTGGGGIDTTDATATAADIMNGKTAYVNGTKVTGTFTLDAEITTQEAKIASQDALITNITSALEGKAVGGGGVTVPDLITITYESTNNCELHADYLTIDETNTITTKRTPVGTSGTMRIVPGSFPVFATVEQFVTGSWGEGGDYIYPVIDGVSQGTVFHLLAGSAADYSVAIVTDLTQDCHLILDTVI